MKAASLNMSELIRDCSQSNHGFGLSLEVLSVLKGKQIDILLNEEQYYEMLEKMNALEDQGDIFGIDWEKYDFVTIAETDKDGNPTAPFSFKHNWLTPVEA